MSEHIDFILDQCQPHMDSPNLYSIVSRSIVDDLAGRYREPWRKHHDIEHLGDVLGFLVEYVDELKNPRTTLWAATGHDSIFIPELTTPGANEDLSAQLTEDKVGPYLPGDETRLIGHYIRKTADHDWDGVDMDLAYLLDADMKILGAPSEEFKAYDDNIREEYHSFKDEEYGPVREHVLRGFYEKNKKGRLFITDVACDLFQDQAAANLEDRLSQF